MRIISIENSNITTLSAIHKYDKTIIINPISEITQDGYTLISNALHTDVNKFYNSFIFILH
jgi:hypothetical protein